MHLHILFKSMAPSSVDTILKQHNSGNIAVSGCIKWFGEPVRLQHATKMVREAEIVDPSGAINFSVWESHIQEIEEEKILHCHQLPAQAVVGKRLATTVKQLPKHKTRILPLLSHHWANQILGLLCPEIMNIYPECNNENCQKKLVKILNLTLSVVYIATEQCSKELLYWDEH